MDAFEGAMLRAGAVLFVTILTAIGAQVSVPLPFTPVPFTLQPMIVLLGGAALGARLGASAQAIYLLIGLAGLPVFAASPVLPQGAARLDGSQLHRVAEQPHQGTGLLREGEEPAQRRGAGHTGLIDQDHVTGTQRPGPPEPARRW